MMMALKKIGPKKVAIRNHFDRTRSRYSRLMIAQSLAMSAHPLFDLGPCDALVGRSVCAHLLQEDLMQRRLDHLESLYRCARLDNAAQQHLRVGAGRHLDLEETVRVVGALDQSLVPQDRRHSGHAVALERECDVSLPVLFLDVGDRAVENLLATRDD